MANVGVLKKIILAAVRRFVLRAEIKNAKRNMEKINVIAWKIVNKKYRTILYLNQPLTRPSSIFITHSKRQKNVDYYIMELNKNALEYA